MRNHPATLSHSCRSMWFILGVVMAGMNIAILSAHGEVLWECSNYTEEAQARCLKAFIERQQEQIVQLEGRLQAQQDLVGQLKGQVDRQSAATAQLQQQLMQPPVTTAVVPPLSIYPFAFAYPPAGIGLYFGRPWIGPGYYGYYGRPYWGPRFFHKHYGRRW
jgi:hypothetical protein